MGFAQALVPILRGLRLSIQAIRAANPQAEIWLNDGADRFRTSLPDLQALAAQLTEQRYAGLDFLHGLVAPHTPLHDLLRRAGMQPASWHRRKATPPPPT